MLEATDLEFCIFTSALFALSLLFMLWMPADERTEPVEVVDEPLPPPPPEKSLCYLRLDDRSRSGKGRAAYLETAFIKLRELAAAKNRAPTKESDVIKVGVAMLANLDKYEDCTVFIFDGSFKLELLACLRSKLGVAPTTLLTLPMRTDNEYIIVEKGLGGSEASVRVRPKLE